MDGDLIKQHREDEGRTSRRRGEKREGEREIEPPEAEIDAPLSRGAEALRRP